MLSEQSSLFPSNCFSSSRHAAHSGDAPPAPNRMLWVETRFLPCWSPSGSKNKAESANFAQETASRVPSTWGRGDKCVRLRSSGTFACAQSRHPPRAFSSHGPGRRRRAFHIRYLGYCGRAVRPWQRRRRPAAAVPGPDSGPGPIVPMSPATNRGSVKKICPPASADSAEQAGRPSGGCRTILTMPAAMLPTAMPTCPSPTSSPSTATGIVPCFGQCRSAGTLQQESNLCIFTAVERGIARRLGADRHYPVSLPKIRRILSHAVRRLRQTMASQAAGCAPGLPTAAHLSSNLC